jgi:hypothetical protein
MVSELGLRVRVGIYCFIQRARSEELMYYYLRVLGGLADAQGVEGRL